jgi:plasmid stabilization system protein ParE
VTLPVKVLPVARHEIREADEWWLEYRPENPDGLREAVERGLALLAEFPAMGPTARGTRAKDVRRLLLRGVPYAIYYRIGADQVEVLSLWHTALAGGPRL